LSHPVSQCPDSLIQQTKAKRERFGGEGGSGRGDARDDQVR
jgi:hypothetical protein